MKRSHLLFTLIITLLYPGSAVPSQVETPLDLPNINLPLLSVETRVLRGTDPRTDFIIQFPVFHEEHSIIDGWMGGPFYFDYRKLAHQNEYYASTEGIGKFYYGLNDSDGPAYKDTLVIPSVTLYRRLELEYMDLSGTIVKLQTSNILLPGLQFTQRLSEAVRLHLDTELFSYEELGNYMIKGGVSYEHSAPWVLSAVYERRSWDIAIDQGSTLYQMEGHSDSVYLKGIYRFGKESFAKGFNIYLGTGYERLTNRGTPALLDPGDINTSGVMVQFGVVVGIAAW